jgi:PIN domain nuclease of toxin-antitoxin system
VRLLLDTHSFLWFITDHPHLSAVARGLIADPQNVRVLSLASAWEMGIKVSLGKLTLAQPLPVVFSSQLQSNRVALLPITLDHVLHIANLPYHHRDPFDRMLIAQALVEQLPIVSADAVFDAYGVQRLW